MVINKKESKKKISFTLQAGFALLKFIGIVFLGRM